jgi:hypothetical protein
VPRTRRFYRLRPRGAHALVLSNMVARAITLPIQAAAQALMAYLTIRTVGVEDYATVGLLVGFQALFSFLNLGTSAAVATAAGQWQVEGRRALLPVLVTTTRVTFCAGLLLLGIGVLSTWLDLWPQLLGTGPRALLNFGSVIVLACVALLQPLGQGSAVLTASGRPVTATITLGFAAPISLGATAVAAALEAPAIAFVVCACVGPLVANTLCTLVASRYVAISAGLVLQRVVHLRHRGPSIRQVAVPALVIWVLLPIAYQTDRLIISHLSDRTELARYNIGAQVCMAAFSVIAVGSSVLWGHYAKARLTSSLPSRQGFIRLTALFTAGGAAVGVVLVGTLGGVARLISGDQVSIPGSLGLAFGMLIACQAFHQPSAMLQNDPQGLRFHALTVSLMTILNVALGIWWTPIMGAAGPVWASVVALISVLAVPSFRRALTILTDRPTAKPQYMGAAVGSREAEKSQ